jgi:hypothetical protein
VTLGEARRFAVRFVVVIVFGAFGLPNRANDGGGFFAGEGAFTAYANKRG